MALAVLPSYSSTGCPVCCEPFSDRFSPRILLSCLHPICAACLRLAADFLVSLRQDNKMRKTFGSRDILGSFLCPYCHTRTAIRRDGQSFSSLASSSPRTSSGEGSGLSMDRKQAALQSALQELVTRRRVIRNAIEATEARKADVLRLSEVLEGEIPEGNVEGLKRVRSSRLRTLNRILERLCVLRQCFGDIDFLCRHIQSVLESSSSSSEGEVSRRVTSIAERLNTIGDILKTLPPLPALTALTALERQRRSLPTSLTGEGRGMGPRRCCLDASVPLYEKVVCKVPAVFLDGGNQRVQSVGADEVCISMTINQSEPSQVTLGCESHDPSCQFLQFVPSSSGQARIEMRADDDETVKVFPNSLKVLPLSLEHFGLKKNPRVSRPKKVYDPDELFSL